MVTPKDTLADRVIRSHKATITDRVIRSDKVTMTDTASVVFCSIPCASSMPTRTYD